MEECNASFIHHDTFGEELGTAIIDDEFLGFVFIQKMNPMIETMDIWYTCFN